MAVTRGFAYLPYTGKQITAGQNSPAHPGWADLREFDGHTRLSMPQDAGSQRARWLLGPGHGGDARGQHGHGLTGAAVAAGPAVGLIDSYELP